MNVVMDIVKKIKIKKYYRKAPGIAGWLGIEIEIKPHIRNKKKKKKKKNF